MKKQILKRAACVVILTGIVIGAICGWKYYENEQRKKQSAYFTEDRLTANEMWIMVNLYHVKSTPVYPWEMDEDKWPDYSYYTIEPTEDTEKVATVLSYELANELYSTEQEAIDFINEKRSEHWNATHNVYAYSLREGNIKRYSDDGEPSGTAGMPVLDVIVKNEIFDVVVVVTRYFGGVLLGTGGLVRAYSHGSKIAVEAAKPVIMQNCLVCEARCAYNQYGKVSSLIIGVGAAVDDTVYESDVLVKFHIKPDLLGTLNKKLADATSGGVTVEQKDEQYFAVQINE